MTNQAQPDDFDIGKTIFNQIKDLPPERQQRLLRWVSEGLGLPQTAMVVQSPSTVSTQMPAKEQPGNAVVIGAGTDIKSFMAAKVPKSDNQFAAVVAYFYRFETQSAERRDSITGSALQEAARLSGRKRLSAPNKTLNNAKAAGYLDSTTPGEFTINSVGENLVAMTLPGSVNVPTRQPRKRKSNTSAIKDGNKAKQNNKLLTKSSAKSKQSDKPVTKTGANSK